MMMSNFSFPFPAIRVKSVIAFLMTLVLVLGAAGAASAKKKKEEERAQFTLTKLMSDKLTKVMEALQAEPEPLLDEAEEILKVLEKKAKRQNPYENALVYQMLAHVASQRNNYPKALAYFEKCLAENAIPLGQQIQTRFNVAQLYLVTEDFENAVKTLLIWFEEVEKPSSSAYYLLAIAYYQMEEIEKALAPAETAVRIAKSPREAWLQLLIGLYYETKQFEKAVVPLKAVLTLKPKKTYWKQLSSLYAHLNKDMTSLAVLQIAYQQGFLEKDRELRSLAQLYLFADLPFRAGTVLAKGFEDEIVEKDVQSYEMLANSWLHAKEYDAALEPLERGAELSDSGVLYQRLGAVHLERERWAKASSALEKAIKKGDLATPGTARLLAGISYYHQGKYDSAKKQLRKARDIEKTRDTAIQWMQLIDRDIEKARRAAEEAAD
jgi:tetratricopeptide (TPR) repeat protein